MTETAIQPIRQPPREALRDLEQVVVQGNLANLTEAERIGYYARVCESLGLNPLTRPFEYITLNGKLTLYARKDATDQLRDMHGVSVLKVEREFDDDTRPLHRDRPQCRSRQPHGIRAWASCPSPASRARRSPMP